MDYNIHKICRVCLEEGALTSIYSSDFAMQPCQMIMIVAKIKIHKSDGLPAVICNNCIYRLGVAYHFKQECENSDIRLRQYLGLPDRYGISDAETNTDITQFMQPATFKPSEYVDEKNSEDDEPQNAVQRKSKRQSRYQRKPLEEHKKRGPKPLPKMPHSCYECHKTFKCTSQLELHMRTHTGEKPFSCSYCPRRFAQKYNLQVHERIHTNYKPFQCDICSKQFSALGNFQAHQRIHAGVRNQICPVCQKGFYSAGDLTKHMVTHAGLKNHHCDVCGKSFSRQRDMRSHKRKMHTVHERGEDDDDDESGGDVVDVNVVGTGAAANDLFRCPDCDKEFNSASGLSVHFRTHSSSLLNLPLGNAQIQMPQPAPPPTHHPHHFDAIHHHPAHPHHLQMNPTAIQTNSSSGMTMLMHHHAASNAAAPSLMHAAQRLHTY